MSARTAVSRCGPRPIRLFAQLSSTRPISTSKFKPRTACLTLSLHFTRAASTASGTGPTYHDAKIEDIRNIGIIAHVDAGKTTTTERMLYYSGVTRHLGNVDHGDTITDFLPMERARGITIQSAAISFNWPPTQHLTKGQTSKTINLIDTPGHQDFRFEVDRCLPVLDGAVCIIDAVKGVEAHTERVWASAQQYSIPRLVFVNKLDRDGASFQKSVLDVASRLNSWPLVCQIPLWDEKGDAFLGVADVIERRGMRWSSNGTCSLVSNEALRANTTLWEEVEKARVKLIERLCEDDDELVEAFAENGTDLPSAMVKASIRRVVRNANGSVVPVFAGSSLRNIGVEPLLDAVVDYLPNPNETHDVEVRIGKETKTLGEVIKTGDKAKAGKGGKDEGALASVFKVVNDPKLFPGTHGMLTFVRVYHGSLHKNTQVWNANLAKHEKPFQITQVSAAKIGEIPYLAPGQIGAITGLKSARTGDTLHILPGHASKGGPSLAELRTMTIRPPDVGPAVAFVSVEAFGQVETKKLADALDKISREDPSLRWSRGDEPGSEDMFVLSGMGQLHLDVAIDRLRTVYQVNASFGDVQVDYKECLTTESTGASRFVYERVVANKSGMAACTVEVQRIEEGEEEVTENKSNNNNKKKKQNQDPPGEKTYTFERDGNVVIVHIKGGSVDSELPFDPDMVSRQLCSGAYGSLARGPRRGSPMHGCRVKIEFDAEKDYGGADTDGHIVNAALQGVRTALREASSNGKVGVLEPVMNVHIACPDDSAGAIQRDITGARGGVIEEIRENSSDGGSSASGPSSSSVSDADSPIDLSQVYAPPDPYISIQSLREAKRGVTRLLEIIAKVPLKEMLSYDTRLRSMTGGRHSFTMELGSFERVVGPREKNL